MTQLEKATSTALRAIALGDSLGQAACESLEDALSNSDMSEEASRSYAEALREAVRGGAVLQETLQNNKGTFGSALGRLSAEVDASKVEVDFCLSLADRILPESAYSATRELNALSNRLLRAASYGFKADVSEARRALSDYATECATLSPEARAYIEALTSLSASEAETAIVEAALSTFFDQKPTPLTDRLGDAFSVALQRFLGELMRRGAIAGRKPAEPTTIVVADDPTPPFTKAGRSKPLGFNFVEWEMRLRRDLAIGREEPGTALRPRDFVGKWKLVFVDDSNPQPLAVKTIDFLADDDALDVVFQADGQVNAPPNPFTTKSQPSAKWIVRPGPAHLDTCEFELVLPDTTVAFCGYVDRGQRIESRFSRRPIKVSGFAFQKDKTKYRLDADANDQQRDSQPSGRFAMCVTLCTVLCSISYRSLQAWSNRRYSWHASLQMREPANKRRAHRLDEIWSLLAPSTQPSCRKSPIPPEG